MKTLDGGTLRESLRSQLWPVPMLTVVLAVALGQFVPFLDDQLDDSLPPVLTGVLFGGGPEAARSLLETISSSMITVTSLTFSLTVVTLQLASSQFSPRLLRTFASDSFIHNTLALFLATFVYALTVLRSIRVETDTDPGFVPELAVTLAFLLTLGSVVGLVFFLAHLAQQIRVETMLRDVHRETNSTLDRIFPEDPEETGSTAVPAAAPTPVAINSSGFLLRVDPDAVLSAARSAEVFCSVDTFPGGSLIEDLPFARVWSLDGSAITGEQLETLRAELNDATRIGFERTSAQDASFGLQQMLDVANKALSTGVNDPTTAVHALGHVSASLCRVAPRITGPATLRNDDGRALVVLARPTYVQLLDLVLDQVITYAFSDARTAARALSMLEEIDASLGDGAQAAERRTAVRRHAHRALAAIEGSGLDPTIRTGLRATAASLSGG